MVNIIIPLYHSKDTIRDVLNSCLAQTKKLFIITLVQDGDGEDYSEEIELYRSLGLKIKLIQLAKNKGPGLARQAGIDSNEMCDYLMFVDSDDMLCPRAVEVLYREAKHNDLDVLASSTIREEPGAPGQVLLATQTPVTWVHGKLYKASYLKEKNIFFPEEFTLNEDSFFNLVAVNCADKFARIDEVTYIWRFNKSSLTRSVDEKEFFVKSWILYVKSQVYGLLEILRRKHEIPVPLAAQTIINIYSHMELAKFYKVSDYDKGKLELRALDIPELRELTKQEDFWKYIYTNLKIGTPLRTGLMFYKTRFIDWLKKVKLAEEVNNDIRS